MSEVLDQASGDDWTLWRGDTVEVARSLPDNSIEFSIFSPPFASLYCYSDSLRDMGNVRSYQDFFSHYEFLVREQFRAMMPGRLIAVHCMLLPTSKVHDGFIGLRDFRSDLRRAYEAAGFISHSEVTIWKDPVTAMQRTKALGLLYKQLRKDSTMSRQGIADYLIVMRKPGENPKPVAHTEQSFPVETWQRYASPVWMTTSGVDGEGFAIPCDPCADNADKGGIDQQDTLNARSAREYDDERHLCPLQLEVIRRAVRLWSNPGDVVWSPFAGIGSEGVVALDMGRKFLGAELKESYWKQASANLRAATSQMKLAGV